MLWRVCFRISLVVPKLWLLVFFILPHTFSLIRYYVHRKLILWLILWFWCGTILFLYAWNQIFFVKIAGHIQGFCWICYFPFRQTNIPCHDDPLVIRIATFLHIYCLNISVPNQYDLVHLVPHLYLDIFPFCDVCNQ